MHYCNNITLVFFDIKIYIFLFFLIKTVNIEFNIVSDIIRS